MLLTWLWHLSYPIYLSLNLNSKTHPQTYVYSISACYISLPSRPKMILSKIRHHSHAPKIAVRTAIDSIFVLRLEITPGTQFGQSIPKVMCSVQPYGLQGRFRGGFFSHKGRPNDGEHNDSSIAQFHSLLGLRNWHWSGGEEIMWRKSLQNRHSALS